MILSQNSELEIKHEDATVRVFHVETEINATTCASVPNSVPVFGQRLSAAIWLYRYLVRKRFDRLMYRIFVQEGLPQLLADFSAAKRQHNVAPVYIHKMLVALVPAFGDN